MFLKPFDKTVGWIKKLLLMPPTMLPVILPAQLNCGQGPPKNELIYQCRNVLRITTSKWVVLICSISLCLHIEFALGQRNTWNLFRTVQKQKIGMLEFQKEIVMTILASFGRNKLAKSLAVPRNVAVNVNLDTKNHILVRSTSKYCRCKHCGSGAI